MRQNPNIDYDIIGFLDNNPAKKGRRIHDVPILGQIDDIEEIGTKEKIEEAIVAIPSISGKEMRKIIYQCDNAGITCKTLPAISDILNGTITINQIREIRIEDLLGREHIELNSEQISDYLSGKRVLVTGAAGSIGLELCRQIMKVGPERLILFERVENEIYNVEMEFSETFHDGPYTLVLGDVLDTKRLEHVMQEYKPQVVFHAAAYKHVPITEANPFEAVKNNVLGTLNVAEISAQYGVEKFVLISTDKAVKPANVMGATKRIAELICQGMNRERKDKIYCCQVRKCFKQRGQCHPSF